MAAGLPTDGTNAEQPRADRVAVRDAPTCRLDEPIERVRERARSAGWDACVVVNEERVVLGLLREAELQSEDGQPVERVMRPGPSTFRPYVAIEEVAAFMADHDVPTTPITTSDGRLVGLVRRDDAVRVTLELHGHHHDEPAEEAP